MNKQGDLNTEQPEEKGIKHYLGEVGRPKSPLHSNMNASDTKLLKDKKSKKNSACQKKSKKKPLKRGKKDYSSDSSDSDSSSESSSDDFRESSSSEETQSEIENEKKNNRRKKIRAGKNSKGRKRLSTKSQKAQDESVESESESDSKPESNSNTASDDDATAEPKSSQSDEIADLRKQLLNLQLQNQQLLQGLTFVPGLWNYTPNRNNLVTSPDQVAKVNSDPTIENKPKKERREKKVKEVKKKRASKLDFKRIDQLWDKDIHNYKLSDTNEDKENSEYDQYIFNVRRIFDWEDKYKNTVVDIKSKPLKEILSEVMEGIKGISLVEESPSVDPNLLFLYLEDFRKFYKNLKKTMCKDGKVKKIVKRNKNKVKHLKVFLNYLDKDYASTKKTLYPMLKSGLITFDLLWALFKPNTLAFTTTYNSVNEPRAFRVELSEKEYSFVKGEWYSIEGKYLEYDGKIWGMGTMNCEVPAFKGARKITSLSCFPLEYHRNEKKLRAELIERGKKFVSLQGVNYRCHEGMAYYKKRKQVIKVNIHGRIMIDPAIHRRILPNYNVSTIRPNDPELFDSDSNCSDNESCDCERSSCDENDDNALEGNSKEDEDEDETLDEEKPKTKYKHVQDDQDETLVIKVPVDEDGVEIIPERLEEISSQAAKEKDKPHQDENKTEPPIFTDDEYLIASPVVLGFAFAEKLWLEFTVSGVKDIVWNDDAYDSLVLEDNSKSIIKALVESHKYHPARSIDDVIQGKGKGLVAVLHGPPGTGKTLTAEGISELLRSPLYMVSAGELGTDPRTLEAELQKILDVAHAWGAVLLLDEADVFLEKRTIQDIHRNALVSIFLRLLEYFQGILFLTTNRVETFDDAFQSRIHIALRYGNLSANAKKSVFKTFLERVRVLEGIETMPFSEEDLKTLSKHNLNGRQIKNTIRTAQALAVQKGEPLSMQHIKKVLEMSTAFDRDLKGGPGYEEAMRGYT